MSRSIRAVPVPNEVNCHADSVPISAVIGDTPALANGPSPPTTEVKAEERVGESFQQLSTRHENLRQTEALLEAGLDTYDDGLG